VRTQRLKGTDGFIVFDLDDAPTSVGVTRLAPKILTDGAQLLARSTTYSFAAFGLQLSGGSAGINAKPDQRDQAVATYVAEVAPLVAERTWVTDPGSGLTAADLAPLREHDPRPPEVHDGPRALELTTAGVLAAADTLLGGLEGRRAQIQGTGAIAKSAAAAAAARGAILDAGATDVDVLFAAGRPGSIDDEVAGTITARVVVPLSPVPVTAKAFAVLSRAGRVYVPDFVALAAPLLAGFDPDGGEPVDRVGRFVAEHADRGTGLWMAAVERAEEFLAGWQAKLPFGRPLA
jgi:glutamate dehydrogenase/leucine dehydrogenase